MTIPSMTTDAVFFVVVLTVACMFVYAATIKTILSERCP